MAAGDSARDKVRRSASLRKARPGSSGRPDSERADPGIDVAYGPFVLPVPPAIETKAPPGHEVKSRYIRRIEDLEDAISEA